MAKTTRSTWVEIDLENVKWNIKKIREQVGDNTLIMAVVKADAYGHGAVPVARAALKAGADRLAVALPEEGVELRQAGFQEPIQILGEVLPSHYPLIVDYQLIPTVCKTETLDGINQLAEKRDIKQKIHIKIDTGMGRIGLRPEEAVNFVIEAIQLPFIKVEGLMTHFARADEKKKEFTNLQWERFLEVIKELEKREIEIPVKHAANSATIIDMPQYALDMVRPGIMLYGLPPSYEVDISFPIKPVLSWKTRVVYVKEVPGGTPLSYGSTYVTPQPSRIATLPLGYADGLPRLLSNKGEVLIKGKRAPIRGRICMDQILVDVTEIDDVRVGDEAVLIGRQENEEITATDMADLVGTINYEITCGISRRVPRIYK